MKLVPIIYFSDVLCVWAYVGQLRVDEVKARHGANVRFDQRFCAVFGDTARKMATQWGEKGGYEGFHAHLMHAAAAFPEIALYPRLWLDVRPASSAGVHLFLKAVKLVEGEACADALAWAMRRAFFEEGRDIASWSVQTDVARRAGLNPAAIEAMIHDGRAHAALSSDYNDATAMGIQGSPSFVLNDGRQKLYGNVGYKIIDANIQELLREREPDQASWC
jgi:predicted DsbA family dithiol-disulfide isomerase